MSYEGHRQMWCAHGHEWSVDYYDKPHEYGLCEECGEPPVQFNEVDDTNCYSEGIFVPREQLTRAPTDEELESGRGWIRTNSDFTECFFQSRRVHNRKPSNEPKWVTMELAVRRQGGHWVWHPQPVNIPSR